jgi:Fic family protein
MPALRKYENSHPWLTFRLDLRRASPHLWIALGEAQSKCQHIAGVPLQPKVASRLHLIYLARGIQATTAIEGNTLTEKEVIERVEKKLKLPPSREYLGKEVDNILQACNRMLKDLEHDRPLKLSTTLIEQLNAQVLRDLKLDPGVVPGEIRKHSVGVGPYRGAPWEDCRYLLDKLCDWLNSGDFDAPPGEEIIYGLIKSIVAHVYLAWIHPFGDGNGRTARLLEVMFLLEAGVPSAAAHLLSNHYNLTRSEYYRQLDQTSKSNGDLLPFIQYAVTGFVDQLREQIAAVQDQQLQVSWVNYVHEQFGAQKTSADRRQRDLVLAMSGKRDFIKPSEIKQLTPEIAVAYAGKTSKTISRDLNRLKKKGLIEAGPQGYRAMIETMLAFLPASRNRKVSGMERPVRAKTGQLDLGL